MLCRSAPIIALHGFLGSPRDFDGFDALGITIPPSLDDFNIPKGAILMGYSMGGRIALQLAKQNPGHFSGLILISANPGLKKHQIQEREKFENTWMNIFEKEAYPQALTKWYNQPIFDSLRNSDQFKKIFDRRLNDPSPWQYMKTYSICKQSNILPNIPTIFIYGEKDQKYVDISQQFTSRFSLPDAGHAPHLEQPELFSHLLCKVRKH